MSELEKLPQERKPVILVTDGAGGWKSGLGGWACLIQDGPSRVIHYGGANETTNNRMELMGVIRGLQLIPSDRHVIIISDSLYVIDGIRSWLQKWKTFGWKSGVGIKEVKNQDLWRTLDALLTDGRTYETRHVRGHVGHPDNELCDTYAAIGKLSQTTGTEVIQ